MANESSKKRLKGNKKNSKGSAATAKERLKSMCNTDKK